MGMDIDELLQTPYWVIDILPKQVPAGGSGQYFTIERYFLQELQLAAIKQQHINMILKLNCYRNISLDEDTAVNPSPDVIADAIRTRYVCLMVDGAMLMSEPDATYLTLFNPEMQLLELVTAIATGEGLFVWQPEQANKAVSEK